MSKRNELAALRRQCFQADLLSSDTFLTIRNYVNAIDQKIIETFQDHLKKINGKVTLVALGGYGRLELCPHSDIDLLILYEGNQNDEPIARLVRALWDMGFPLGCVVRSLAECKRILGEDLATDTALLDARYLTGNKFLFRQFLHKVIGPFFERKRLWFVNEMNAALRDAIYDEASPYFVEPHLKSGICTLRDCQRVVWGTRVYEKKYFIQEQQFSLIFDHRNRAKFLNAYQALLKLRCALHIVSDRRLDILEFSQQQPVAEFLNVASNDAGLLMEFFFKTVFDIKQLLKIYIEKQNIPRSALKRFRWYFSSIAVGNNLKLLDGILTTTGSAPPSDENPCCWILRVYLLSIKYQAFPGTRLQNLIRSVSETISNVNLSNEVYRLFIELMSSRSAIGRVISNMYETGFLEVLLPELKSIKCKVEYDSYHEFTVDQHILYALSLVDDLHNDSNLQVRDIVNSLSGLFPLRMAVLLHDIGKSLDGDHAYSGALIATNIGDRLGIEETLRDQIAFLIRHHLDLSQLAFQREPEEQTVAAFAEEIQNCFLLDQLYLLTIVDIRSVGRKTWTVWKSIQLKVTYERVRKYLENKSFCAAENQYETNIDLYGHLFVKLPHNKAIHVEAEVFTGFERLIIGGYDRSHFFEDIVGCLSSEGYNILSAQISTANDGRVLDIFSVEPDSVVKISSEQRIQNIIRKWESITNGACTSGQLIEERIRLYPEKPHRVSNEKESEIKIDNSISKRYSVIELRTPDRHGLLFRVAQCFTLCGVNIVSAKLSTRVAKAIDIFYVTGADGEKINPDSEVKIETDLLSLLSKEW